MKDYLASGVRGRHYATGKRRGQQRSAFFNQRAALLRLSFRAMLLIWATLSLSSCVAPVVLEQAVLAYDRTVSRISTSELLLNIARARHHHPLHFTTVSSVAATFDFRMHAGATPPLGATQGGQGLAPVFGASVAENPTITIVPVGGEEFTQRVLTPMTENKFYMLFQQGADLGLLLRMMASELRLSAGESQQILWNRPNRPREYKEFRRRVLHLAALYQAHKLFLEPVVVRQDITLAGDGPEQARVVLDALERGYRWNEDEDSGTLTRKVGGRIVIANYDPDLLSRDERRNLYFHTNSLLDNEILVDIRPDYPGGDYPMRGTFRLRGFLAIIGFLALGATEGAEYAVDKDPRSGSVRVNPARTLEVRESEGAAPDAAFSVSYEQRHYSIPKAEDPVGVWHLEAFRLLNQLYELSVYPAEFARPAPAITISK